jgi:hypothetical protein
MGLKLGPLSLVSKLEELLARKSSGSGLENLEYGRRDPLRRIFRCQFCFMEPTIYVSPH